MEEETNESKEKTVCLHALVFVPLHALLWWLLLLW
jgi:hypothetical protein